MNKATRSLVFYSRMVAGYQRFNKVVGGEWQIVDMPTPEQLKQAAEQENKKAAPVLTPTTRKLAL